jgi:5-methylcytosine-specific restriction endonuclease McrBC regulatory subunit McrC
MNIATLNLTDSQFVEGETKSDWYTTGIYCQAIDRLNKDITSGNIEIYSLSKNQSIKKIDDLVWYHIDESRVSNSNVVITKASFYTSHYIGFYSTNIFNQAKKDYQTVNVTIKPRFGKDSKLFNYLLSYAYNLYIPKGSSSYEKEHNTNYWLMAVLWKASLEKALTQSHIPKEYQKIEKNQRVFRGKLKISQQIRNNLTDKSKFFCQYRKLSMDNTINRTIRYIYDLLIRKGFNNLLKNIAEYDNKLHSFGVQSNKTSIEEITKIRYSKLNKHYRPVMQLSKAIFSNHMAASNPNTLSNNSFAYFIDISELWENYLLKVLQRNLSEYEVYSPNEIGGEYLFENNNREIKPDIIIRKEGNVAAVIDAKYKRYQKIGKTSVGYSNVSREDLYQMATYLYHYGTDSNNITGLFVSPVEEQNNDLLTLKNNPNHKIGVLNLNIKQWDSTENEVSLYEIKEKESKFVSDIKSMLRDKTAT